MNVSIPSVVTSAEALMASFLEAGGKIMPSSSKVIAAVATNFMVDCAGEPPKFFDSWTYEKRDNQAFKVFKGIIDVREITGVQAPSQLKSWTRLDKIWRELAKYEFAGAHSAAWLAKPENVAHFPEEWKTGYTVFLERYRGGARRLGAVYLYWFEGRVCVDGCCAGGGGGFNADYRFAVRKLSA
jgi:hypothetical protein